MNIRELIEELREIEENYGDIEVRWAAQPAWPFAYSIGGVIVDDGQEYEDDGDTEPEELEEPIAYIGEGSQLEYLKGSVKNTLQNNGIWSSW